MTSEKDVAVFAWKGEVASWADKAREATFRRDAAIRQMHIAGASLRAIGEAAGLSHMAVSKILKKGQ